MMIFDNSMSGSLLFTESHIGYPTHFLGGQDRFLFIIMNCLCINASACELNFKEKSRHMSATWLRPVRPDDGSQNSNFAHPREI